MFRPLYFLATFAEAGLSVFGIRSYEQPAYTVTRTLSDGVELRAYPARVAAETTIADGGDGEAFGRLFRYITGANQAAATMRMTAPVQQESGRMIAMTVPVELAGDPGARSMRFFLPKENASHPPVPTDPKVRIVTLPPATFATLRFSGTLTAASRAQAAARLHAVLSREGIGEAGPPSILSYDPPFTIPFLRRNEVAIPVASR
jgi:hypothetical protein